MATFRLSLDTAKQSVVPKAVRARVGDAESCVIVASVTSDGEDYDLEGLEVRFECLMPDGTVARDAGVSVDGSTVTYAVPAEILRSPGIVRVAYFRILRGTALVDSTESFSLDVREGIDIGGLGVPSDYLPELDEALAAIKQQSGAIDELAGQAAGAAEAAGRAASAADAAASAANSAAGSAGSAASAAQQAASAANGAAGAANSAASAATEAAQDALGAAEKAIAAADMVSQDKTIFLSYDTVGDIDYLTLTDESED